MAANASSSLRGASASPPNKEPSATISTINAKPATIRWASQRLTGRLLNISARLFMWYLLLGVFFRCPANLEFCTPDTFWACEPYFKAKAAIAPHAREYFNAYASPYVQVVQPYYDAVDRSVITPVWTSAVTYGGPHIRRAEALGRAQWERLVQPQLATAQAAAAVQYEQRLAPYVTKAQAAVGPYYNIAQASALQTHHDVILPLYKVVTPYALQGYAAVFTFARNTAVPSTVWAWNQATDFVDTTLLPRLRIIYEGTVEPQLFKLGLKLSEYSGIQSKTEKSYHSTAPSSFTKPSQPSGQSSLISTKSKTTSVTTTASSTSQTASATAVAAGVTEAPKLHRPEPILQEPAEKEESEERRVARETVAEDLKAWQEKYAKAADEGAAEIEKRVEEIGKRMIRRNARTTGKALVDQLQQTVVANLVQLRREIQTIVGKVQKDGVSAAGAEEEVVAAVRRAGVQIKEQAQAVRTWREEYSKELEATVSRSAENHFQILGSIRDLALQKIGMKWAWMEGVTYKDWAKYHQLKSRFDEWENDLEQLIVTHPMLEEAQAIGFAVENDAMETASSAVKELLRLKQVALWKIEASDDSEDFDNDSTEAAAAAAVAAAVAAKAEAEAAAEAAVATQKDEAAREDASVANSAKAEDEEITAVTGTAIPEETEAAETVAFSEEVAIEEATAPASGTTEVRKEGEVTATTTTEAETEESTLGPKEAKSIVGEEGKAETVMEEEPAKGAENAQDARLPVDKVATAPDVPVDEVPSVGAEGAAAVTALVATESGVATESDATKVAAAPHAEL